VRRWLQVRAQLEREVANVAVELAGVQEATRVANDARQEASNQVGCWPPDPPLSRAVSRGAGRALK
jgi:hypothetical protein